MEISAEYGLEHVECGSAELHDLAQKNKILEKLSFHGFRKILHFLSTEIPFLMFLEHKSSSEVFLSMLSAEFPFSGYRILGDLFRAPLQCYVLNLHFWSTEFQAVYLE